MDYTPKRTRNIYNPNDSAPYRISRSKVELFLECPYCFYIDRRCGIARPPTYAFNLNLAVDLLLKKEFDQYRKEKTPHPLMANFDSTLELFDHEDLNKWRENFVGVQFFHEDTNLILTGAVDDLWKRKDDIIVVDYKATSSPYKISYNHKRYDQNKRQLEFYSYLLANNGFSMSDDGYFVVCNAKQSEEAFNELLQFDISIIEHKIDTSWIEDTIFDLSETLMSDSAPCSKDTCNYCKYRSAIGLL